MNICTLCKSSIPEMTPEVWTTSDGLVLPVARSAMPSAVVDTSVGEFEICEGCYQRGTPSFFTSEDVAEMHYQFGLEYRDRGQWTQCIDSLTEARRVLETADTIAALAAAESELGHREVAMTYYRRALEIDPDHFMSRENLRRLNDDAA